MKDYLEVLDLTNTIKDMDIERKALAAGFILSLLGQESINQPFTFSQLPQPQPAAAV